MALIAFSFMRPSVALAETASEFVNVLADSAIQGLADQSLSSDARVRRVYDILAEGFDLHLISRFVLGAQWGRATAAQRAEYGVLFEQYLVNTYASRLRQYGGESFQIKGEHVVGKNKDTVVSSEIVQKNGSVIKVDWRVRGSAGAYKVVDIMFEGISMVITQRDEFASVIRRKGAGIEGLLAELRDRTS
jgi:phospholipid transport system substrate-binding protein